MKAEGNFAGFPQRLVPRLGSHYSKLKAIKDKYDPYGLFVVAEGVGSEEWNKELTCRL